MIIEEEERSRGMSPKEREEAKKMKTKQSGMPSRAWLIN
jgi:hypothetical protein